MSNLLDNEELKFVQSTWNFNREEVMLCERIYDIICYARSKYGLALITGKAYDD